MTSRQFARGGYIEGDDGKAGLPYMLSPCETRLHSDGRITRGGVVIGHWNPTDVRRPSGPEQNPRPSAVTTPRRINVNRMRKNVGLPPVTPDGAEVDEHAGMRAITDLTGRVIRWVPERSDSA